MVRKRHRVFKLLVGYGILFIINGCFFTWSILSPYFADFAPHWTSAQLALPVTINVGVSAVGGLCTSHFLKKFTPRMVVRASGVVMAAGWLIMLLLQWNAEIYWLCLGYVFLGFGSGVYYPVIGKVLTAWYPERSGAVSGGLLLVSGIGAVAVAALEEIVINAYGIFKFCLLAALIYMVIFLIGGHWMVMPVKQEKDTVLKESGGEALIRRAVKTPLFWIFFLWLVMLASGGLLVINNAGTIFSYYQAPAAIGMFSMVATGIGCLLMGISVDRFKLRASMLAASMFSLFSCMLLLVGHWGGATWLILIGTLFSGVAYGTTTSAKMAGVIRLYGDRYMTTFFGVFNLNIFPASVLGPYISGQLLMLGEGYYPCFLFITALSAVSLLLVILGWKQLRKSHA